MQNPFEKFLKTQKEESAKICQSEKTVNQAMETLLEESENKS